jgi:uncharacterized glyoxalase superfamily protein PhnB
MRSPVRFRGRHRDEVAIVDTTGGTIEAIHFDDNHVRKVLLRLRKNGVTVEMALQQAAAADFAVDYQEALDWLGASSQQTGETDAG